jgi:uncharacterized protein (TIGR03437 family)
LKGGHWEGTWTTSDKTLAQVTLKLQAQNLKSTIHGEREVSGALQKQTDPPTFDQAHVVSTVTNHSFVALAPGSVISIYGNRLAESTQVAPKPPLPTKLVDTTVFMAGRKLPLFQVGQGQINAVVPYELKVNTTHQVLVQRGLTYSQPVQVNVAAAQPAIATKQGVADIYDYPANGAAYQVTDKTPAKAGDVVVIYNCVGLGITNPPVADGTGAPKSPNAQTQNPVKVTIGGEQATVQYAELMPGMVGVYDVSAVVPSGLKSGNQSIVLTVAGQMSQPVNLPIQ